ncbi:uncharacterized protein KY384_003153 [Bacidia gigantensis]|uniref:uncharacterized protein n=1 Tax=Bacidia gigantensis TaxID=2732470 RepID=UPI001D04468D|nr:uncharacterized protein KY384_003153 [Bacidia gigantensis]KAG8531524.1 hypothetical protein KY384_003153 [Bacidia gigantensis]
MPRPKRPKLVHTVSSTLRMTEHGPPSSIQKRQRNTSALSEHAANASDDTDGLVQRKAGWTKTDAIESAQYTMSGALRPHPNAGPKKSMPSGSSTKDTGRSDTRTRRTESVNTQNRTGSRQKPGDWETAPIAISDPPLLPYSAPGKQASLVSTYNGTPLAQSSMLGAIQFKKRARQPSLLDLAQTQPDLTLDFDDEFPDFRPDDESTPLVKPLSNLANSIPSEAHHLGPRKRKFSSSEVQVPATQSQHQVESSLSLSPPRNESPDPLPSDALLLEPTLPRYRQVRTPSPSLDRDTIEPPLSSSSPVKPLPRNTRKSRSERTVTKRITTGKEQRRSASSPPSPQSTTSTPRKVLLRKRPPEPKPLTTATLQNLLPRRRLLKQTQNPYDVLSSSDGEIDLTHLGEDEDELSLHAKSKIRRNKSMLSNNPKRSLAVSSKGNHRLPGSKTKRESKTYSRINDDESHTEGDDAGGDLEGTSFEIDPTNGKAVANFDVKAKAEMKRLANKFKEVDEYTMEFEDMTGDGNSSQMKDAR